MRPLPIALTAFCAAALSAAALAATPFETTFAGVDGGKPCYARTYDRMHLKAHPWQTVTSIEVDFTPENPDGVKNTAAKFELGFAFRLRKNGSWYPNNAYCSAKGAGFACSLESDGGEFTLTPQTGGALRLDVVNRGGRDSSGDQISAEGDDFGSFGKPGGDDLSFILNRAPHAVCDASTAGSGY